MAFLRFLSLSTACLLLATVHAGAAEIRGRVVTGSGVGVEHAQVLDTVGGRRTFTTAGGRFALECGEDCSLAVTHPRFAPATVEVTDSSSEITVRLAALVAAYEELVVSASRGVGDALAPVSIASTVIHVDETVAAPSSLLEVVGGTAGVSENGQGGLFQTYSIRGVSRQRVMSLIDGVPVVGERRAGVSTSFVDPQLMGGVEVLRGPASTYYGSGALGGVIQVFPRRFEGVHLATGYDSFGDENYQVAGWGDGRWSAGIARRDRDNDDAADGGRLNERFTQYSATVARRWQRGEHTYDFVLIPSRGDDIGKSNSDFPERVTDYPEEAHLLARFGVRRAERWRLDVFAHANEVTTEALRVGESWSRVENQALDGGVHFQREIGAESRVSGRYGFDYFGRRGVEADETIVDLTGSGAIEQRTLDGERDDLAAYGVLEWDWGPARLQTGARWTWQQQGNAGFDSRDDSAWSGFVGWVQPAGERVELTANVGTGLRFASLGERFFSGTTGRGEVIGNPDLDPERSVNADVGFRWFGERVFVAAQLFRLNIDDYIERVDLAEDLQTFVNLDSGVIEGIELEGFWRAGERWRLAWNGHAIQGDSDGGGPVADVPPDRIEVEASHRRGRWNSRLSYQYRAEVDEPGAGEMPIPSADLVALAVSRRLGERTQVTLRGTNLLDEIYFSSADDKAPVAAGRAVGVGLVWTP